MIYDEFANMTEEQKSIIKFNYTSLLYRPDRCRNYVWLLKDAAPPSPLVPGTPTTFAFDPRSPLRALVPADRINPGLAVPATYDFHLFPEADVLAPLYRHEALQAKKPKKLEAGVGARDPMLADK